MSSYTLPARTGVVAETRLSPLFVADAAFDLSHGRKLAAVFIHECQRAYKPRRALFKGKVAQVLQHQVIVVLVMAVIPCITGAENAGGPIQGIHCQPGIVRQACHAT